MSDSEIMTALATIAAALEEIVEEPITMKEAKTFARHALVLCQGIDTELIHRLAHAQR